MVFVQFSWDRSNQLLFSNRNHLKTTTQYLKLTYGTQTVILRYSFTITFSFLTEQTTEFLQVD
uniref:Uncharacterized protein n=1 Tax=Rhizophora mucronata TaxID=61149 RepID=A0A2P2JHB8_RHIMU